jgi:hypothetical protein
VFAPDAVVLHAIERRGAIGKLRDAARWTETMRIFAEHPQTRVMLNRGLFWNGWHYLVLRSLLVLLLPRRLRPLGLRRMLLTRHLLQLRTRAREAGAGAWAVPFLIVHDLVEVWSVVRGGVRYRTPVL